jgi:hypothetical protein
MVALVLLAVELAVLVLLLVSASVSASPEPPPPQALSRADVKASEPERRRKARLSMMVFSSEKWNGGGADARSTLGGQPLGQGLEQGGSFFAQAFQMGEWDTSTRPARPSGKSPACPPQVFDAFATASWAMQFYWKIWMCCRRA